MENLIQVLRKHECPDSTYVDASPPLVFDKAKGSEVFDVDGNRYIDLCAGFGVMAFGHNHKDQQSLFSEQLSDVPPIVHGMGDVYPSGAKIQLIEDLVNVLPDHLSRVALSLSGAQAVEIALKTALLRKPQGDFVVFHGAYHGLDLGVLPATTRKDFKEPFDSWIANHRVHELPYNCSEAQLIELLESLNHGLAGILVEPVQGRAGIKLPQDGWLKMLKEKSGAYDGLLIFDEVFTGLGRIGSLSSSFEVEADLICLGKALGGGFPLSACCGTEEAFSAWPQSSGEAIHTGTFFGHPLSCRMGSKVLEKLSKTSIVEDSAKLGAEVQSYLAEEVPHDLGLKEVRGKGLMLAIEFEQPGLGADLMNRLRARGVIALASGDQGQTLTMSPALNIKKDLLWEALDILLDLLKEA